MLLLLPIFSCILLYLIFYGRSHDFARSLANSWLCIVLFVWCVTEGLSFFHIWTKTGVVISWIIILVFLGAAFFQKNLLSDLKQYFRGSGKCQKIYNEYGKILFLLIFFWFFVLVTAVLSSQSNVDSLKYHLPRIMHWIQNKSVGYYATNTDLQVRYPALSEYLVSQIYMLCTNDRMANLVQTGAYICSGIMVFGISRKLGVTVRFSFAALTIYYMMPMAIAQLYTTQTDIIAGMFLLVYVYFILDLVKAKDLGKGWQAGVTGTRLAVSVMLGYLCKPTICFVMIVFFFWMCIVRLCRRDRMVVLLQYMIIGGVTAIILYTPLFIKSYQTYRVQPSISATEEEIKTEDPNTIKTQENEKNTNFVKSAGNALAPDSFNVVNALKSPSEFILTCVKNLGRNSSSICFPKWNDFIVKAVFKIGEILDGDVSNFQIQQKSIRFFDRDTASNPSIMLFWVLGTLCVVFRVSRTNKEQTIYAICAGIGLLIQCGLMGFTMFRTRYLVGAMAVLCPFFACVLEKIRFNLENKKKIMTMLITIGCFGAINTFWFALALVKDGFGGSSMHQYFQENDNEFAYQQILEFINENEYKKIGVTGILELEYVLWQEIDDLERLEWVNVQKEFLTKYEDINYSPDCIIMESIDAVDIGTRLECHGIVYECIWETKGYENYYSGYIPVPSDDNLSDY